MGYQGWDKILMITLTSSKKILGGYKIMRNTVVLKSQGTVTLFTQKEQIPSPKELRDYQRTAVHWVELILHN